jgi:hypothetical protein
MPAPGWAGRGASADAHPAPAQQARGALASQDAWFHSHYQRGEHRGRRLEGSCAAPGSRILDLGCGDGIMALGVCEASGRAVVGSDLTDAFRPAGSGGPGSGAGPRHPPAFFLRPTALHFVSPTDGSTRGTPGRCSSTWTVWARCCTRSCGCSSRARGFSADRAAVLLPFGSHLRRLIPRPGPT